MHHRIDLSTVARRLLTQGHTTASIARQVGVTQPTISRLATGKSASLGWDAAVKLLQMAGGEISLPPGSSEAAAERSA